jgi:4-amino-4-deoxy-L-arabinose transferase-like glycosyltransferase
MFHWLGALATIANGRVSEAPIRLPSLVASVAATGATAIAAWTWWGPETAVLAAFVLATSFQWIASSVSARVDMVLACAITLALLLFARAIETGRRIPATAYALLTVAALTKGPVGIVLPFVIALVTLAVRGEIRFLGWRDLRLLALATAAAGLWYVAAFVVGGQAFIDKQILKENVFRVLDPDAVEAGHVAPFWFYLPLLAAGLAPWSLFVPGLVANALARTRRRTQAPPEAAMWKADVGARSGPSSHQATGDEERAALDQIGTPETADEAAAVETRAELPLARPNRFDAHTTFALVWAIVPFVLFSIAGSKRAVCAVYLLPAYPAYAMLVAVAWTRILREGAVSVPSLVLAGGAALLSALLAIVGLLVVGGAAGIPLAGWIEKLVSNADVGNVAPMLEAVREHAAIALPCAAVMLGAAWLTAMSAARGRWTRVVSATAIAMFAVSATVSTSLLPALASKRSTRTFMRHVEENVPLDVPLSFYRAFDYGAVFYRGRAIPVRQALSDVPEIDGAWLLVWPALLPALEEEARRTGTGGEAAGAYEAAEVIASADASASDRSSLVLVRIVRQIQP